jgi:hypothetical protein
MISIRSVTSVRTVRTKRSAKAFARGLRGGIGAIPGRADAAPGSMMTVWIDKAGRLTARPLTRADVADHVIGAVAVTAAALALLLSAVGWAASLVHPVPAGPLGGGLAGGRTPMGQQAVSSLARSEPSAF